MRILSGEAKGRVLKTREGKGTRPTDSRSREMLFNILGERVVDARFLDIYAGSGAVGLEALSRGAAFCVFIEQNAAAAAAIRENIKACGWQDRAQVWHTNMKSALRRFAELLENDENHPEKQSEARFHIVFADPPFTNPRELSDLAARLDNLPRLLHNGTGQKTPDFDSDFPDDAVAEPLLVVQHHRKEVFHPTQFEVWQERRAGESVLTFCRSKPEIHAAQLPVQAVPDAGAVVQNAASNAVPTTVHNENPMPLAERPKGGLP